MDIDTTGLSEDEASQVQMFAAILSSMSSEDLEGMLSLLQAELATRDVDD